MRSSMVGDAVGVSAAGVALAAAAVFLGVAVEDFVPAAGKGDADAIIDPRHRSEIGNDKHLVVRGLAFAEEAEDAFFVIVGIDPFEAGGIAIKLVQGGLAAIGGVEIANPTLDAQVRGPLQKVP